MLWIGSVLSYLVEVSNVKSMGSYQIWPVLVSALYRNRALALHFILSWRFFHVVSRINEIIKFADDITILVAKNTDVGLDVEFRQFSKWADINRLTLNTAKTKEIVFRRPKDKYFHIPPAVDSIEQVDCCKLLDVFFNPVLRRIHMCNYTVTVRTEDVYSETIA